MAATSSVLAPAVTGRPATSPQQDPATSTRLVGRRLLLARTAWFALFGFTLVLFAMSLPVRLAYLRRTFQNLTPAQELVLRDLGIRLDLQPVLIFGLEVAVVLAFMAVAVLIFLYRSDDWLAMLIGVGGVVYVTWASAPLDTLASVIPFWQRPVNLAHALGFGACLLGLYTFPNGRFCPGWTRLLLVPYGLCAAAWVAFPSSLFDLSWPYRLAAPSFLLVIFWWLTGGLAQFYRLTHVSTPLERQQTKWIVLGVVLATLGYVLFGQQRILMPAIAEPVVASVVFDLVGVPLYLCLLFVVPLAFVVSIFRDKLWDVEVIVSRAFVYTTLTAVLAGLYMASVGFFQRLFVALTGTTSEGAIVLTTLTVAAAFTLIRSRLQSLADRHVKERPDPTKNLQRFGQQVEAFVDLLDARQLTAKTLREAVAALGARGGAVYLHVEGQEALSSTVGEWPAPSVLSVAITHGRVEYGSIRLAARMDGTPYTDQDRALLEHCAAVVGRAIDLAQRHGTRARAVASTA